MKLHSEGLHKLYTSSDIIRYYKGD